MLWPGTYEVQVDQPAPSQGGDGQETEQFAVADVSEWAAGFAAPCVPPTIHRE